MPEIIARTLQGTPLLVQWYQWGVIVGFVAALAITAWIFVDAQRSGRDATVWKSLAAVASVIGIPALLARVHAGFALEMRDSLGLVAIFSGVGALLALSALIGYASTRTASAAVCPVCGQPQEPTWTHCPYHSAPQPVVAVSQPIPITNPAPPDLYPTPFGGSAMSSSSSPRETLIAGLEPNALKQAGGAPVQHRGTVILSRESEPAPLALLIIKSGPYANTTLPLKAGVNTLGRDGVVNDHPIDDAAVSERHLSIRYQDGHFTATDLDSSNGTFVNDQKIDKQQLQSNDAIRIGKTEMVFVQVGQNPTEPAP
jgi:pSer/pThr/pTyr-binding forkhead associated (FHA) protein